MFKNTVKTFTLLAALGGFLVLCGSLIGGPTGPINEVRGVVAHEVAHIRHRDILIGSVAAAVATGISAIANMAMFAGMFGGDDEDSPNPVPLASALMKIDALARRVPMDVSPQQAAAYIVNPLTGRQVSFAKLFLTHPPTEDRVARLLGRAAPHLVTS
jgi:heat shock protein HtpX